MNDGLLVVALLAVISGLVLLLLLTMGIIGPDVTHFGGLFGFVFAHALERRSARCKDGSVASDDGKGGGKAPGGGLARAVRHGRKMYR